MPIGDRPFYTDKALLNNYYRQAVLANVVEILVNEADWQQIKDAVGTKGQSLSADGVRMVTYKGRKFICRPNPKTPSGTLDLSDPENPILIRD
jgi:hypothetical protein